MLVSFIESGEGLNVSTLIWVCLEGIWHELPVMSWKSESEVQERGIYVRETHWELAVCS